MTKLIDLEPRWIVDDQKRRIGISFRYPIACNVNRDDICRAHVPFANPLDGAPENPHGWQRTGDTFETLTLSPSVLAKHHWEDKECTWHGFVTNGEVKSC